MGIFHKLGKLLHVLDDPVTKALRKQGGALGSIGSFMNPAGAVGDKIARGDAINAHTLLDPNGWVVPTPQAAQYSFGQDTQDIVRLGNATFGGGYQAASPYQRVNGHDYPGQVLANTMPATPTAAPPAVTPTTPSNGGLLPLRKPLPGLRLPTPLGLGTIASANRRPYTLGS